MEIRYDIFSIYESCASDSDLNFNFNFNFIFTLRMYYIVRAFAAVQQMESDAIRAGIIAPKDILSTQQVLKWSVTST